MFASLLAVRAWAVVADQVWKTILRLTVTAPPFPGNECFMRVLYESRQAVSAPAEVHTSGDFHGIWPLQMPMAIGFNIQICDALSWLVVLAAWARKTPEGQPYGILTDLAVYWGLAVLPAAVVGFLLERQARHRFMTQHDHTRPLARND